VREIFAREGEAGFRRREQAALRALEPELAHGAVIATGGGAFADESARSWMEARGITVWLDAALDAIERRVPRDGSRPLFGDRAALAALYEERVRGYATAGMRVPADAQPPEDIARTIARALAEMNRR
jgi:shikimate kinase